jgi:hypothetical protein
VQSIGNLVAFGAPRTIHIRNHTRAVCRSRWKSTETNPKRVSVDGEKMLISVTPNVLTPEISG